MYNLRNSIETKKITYLLPNLLELSLFVNLFLFANLKRNSRVNRNEEIGFPFSQRWWWIQRWSVAHCRV